MGKIYINQTALKITATVNQDITGYQSIKIFYKKPSGVIGSWTADLEDLTTGKISFSNFQTDTLDQAGKWTFYAEITFSDGKIACGEQHSEHVFNKFE